MKSFFMIVGVCVCLVFAFQACRTVADETHTGRAAKGAVENLDKDAAGKLRGK